MLVIATPASALITYVDAVVPTDVGNSSPATATASGTDDLWRLRTGLANGGTIYEAGGIYGDGNTEDCLRLLTKIVVPANPNGEGFDVYAYFWSDTSQWRIGASLTNDAVPPLYIAYTAPATQAVASDFNSAVLVAEGNRLMWQASLGVVGAGVTTGDVTIKVYIDDDAAHLTHNSRSWYDGIGYEPVPEPTTVALLGLGGLALLRKKRA
jgi:hypothetical protein